MRSITLEQIDKYAYTESIPSKTWLQIDKICKVVRDPFIPHPGEEKLHYLLYILFRLPTGEKKAYIHWDSATEYKYIKYRLPLKCMSRVDGMIQVNIVDDGYSHVVPEINRGLIVGPQVEYGELLFFCSYGRGLPHLGFRSAKEHAIALEIRERRNKLEENKKTVLETTKKIK